MAPGGSVKGHTKRPHRKAVDVPFVLLLERLVGGERMTVGAYSDVARATSAAAKAITAGRNVNVGRLPGWVPNAQGGYELTYAREGAHFHFRLSPWALDSEVG